MEPYFAGVRGVDYTASVIWRVHVPEEGERLWPRPAGREAIEVPLRAVREALDDEEEVARLRPDGVTVETARAPELHPGDEIVLPVDRGLLDEFGWNQQARKPIVDVSLAGQGVPLEDGALRRLCGLRFGGQIATALGGEDDDIEPDDREQAVSAILEALSSAAAPPGWEDAEWADLIGSLGDSIEEPRDEVPRIPLPRVGSRAAATNRRVKPGTPPGRAHGRTADAASGVTALAFVDVATDVTGDSQCPLLESKRAVPLPVSRPLPLGDTAGPPRLVDRRGAGRPVLVDVEGPGHPPAFPFSSARTVAIFFAFFAGGTQEH